MDSKQLDQRLQAHGLTRLPTPEAFLTLDPQTTPTGFVLKARRTVRLSVRESAADGYLQHVGYDANALGVSGQLKPRRLGDTPGAPIVRRFKFTTRGDFDGGTSKVFLEYVTLGGTIGRSVLIGRPRVFHLTPDENAAPADGPLAGHDLVFSPQRRLFALSFDLEVTEQTFTVTEQQPNLRPEDPPPESRVRLRQALFRPGSVNRAEPDAVSASGRAWLIYEVVDFSEGQPPLVMAVAISPSKPASRVVDQYTLEVQINVIDTGLGDRAPLFGS